MNVSEMCVFTSKIIFTISLSNQSQCQTRVSSNQQICTDDLMWKAVYLSLISNLTL